MSGFPGIGLSIQAQERGINRGTICAFFDDHYASFRVSPIGVTHSGGAEWSAASIADTVNKVLGDADIKGILLDSALVASHLASTGTFSGSGKNETYSRGDTTYPIIRPMRVVK
jgi:hypothetical protein